MLFKDKLKEPVIYKGSNKAINELNQIQEYLKTHTSKEQMCIRDRVNEI